MTQVPFEAVVEAVAPTRAMGYAPLVQVTLVLQNTPDADAALTLPGVAVRSFGETSEAAKFELSLDLTETAEGLVGTLSFASQVFDRATVERFAAMFTRLLQAAVSAPDTLVADLPLMDEAERHQMVALFNDTAVEYPRDRTVVDLFCAQAAERPDAVAVVDGTRTLTYRALDQASNRLARHLVNLGVGPEGVVGVCLERSAELIVSLLAIWKAGGAYLPLDPDYPAARLAFMLNDAGAYVVLATSDTAAALHCDDAPPRLVLIDDPANAAVVASLSNAPVSNTERTALLTPQSLAYVIYTSGSTGLPKGVLISHRSITVNSGWFSSVFDRPHKQAVLSRIPISFDFWMKETLFPLISGSMVYISSELFTSMASRICSAAKISTIMASPRVFEDLYEQRQLGGFASLTNIHCGGDRMTAELRERLRISFPDAKLFQEYGPTETTLNVTFEPLHSLERQNERTIGSPVSNTQVYVVDARLNPVPVGVSGELLIGGVQVSRGYLGRSGLTAEKFIADPFSGEPGARLYRTGDLARWRPDGTLEFLGRLDDQIKVRGMRVELGEIETALTASKAIAQAVVSAPKDETGDTRLVAYVVPAELSDADLADALGVAVDALTDAHRDTLQIIPLEDHLNLAAVRTALKRTLPEHMVPSGFVGLSRVPLTASGKVDRKALPEAYIAVASTAYAAPRSEREALMCTIMRDVTAHDRLSLEQVGIDDQFFDIGGHSIFAAQFAMRLEKALGEPVPVRLIFEAPTVRELATRLEERFEANRPAVERADRTQPIPASFEQERMWLANRIHGERIVYNEGLPLLLRGRVNTQALVTAVQGTLDRYEVLRTRLVWQDEQLIQQIDPEGSLKVTFEDWSDRLGSAETLEKAAEDRARALLTAPYDLATEHPCRALVIKLSDEAHVWVLATHHAVGDNWSISHVMPAVFLALYDAACEGSTADLPIIPLHYADYAAWQRSEAMAPILDEQLGYWRKTLSGAPEGLDLPSDRPRPTVREHHGDRLLGKGLNAETWRAVERFAVAHNGTPFMVFVAGLTALLSRVSGTRDIVIGTPHVMKPDAGLWEEFGYFGNTLALRTAVDPLQSFADHFAKVRQTVLAAFAHQDVPFEAVVKELGVTPANATPVFQVMLVMHAFLDEGAFVRDDFAIEALGARPEVAKTDLTVDVNPGADGVRLSLEYATDIFNPETIERLSAMFTRLLGAAVASPQTLLADLPLMDEAERHQVVALFNDTAVDTPQERTVVDLFCAQAAERPDAVAVVDGARTLTCGALDRASNRLARHLINLGVGPEVVVGVCLERSAELIVSLLAIWKAGGAYMPLDPDYPGARLAFMRADAGAEVVLATSDTAAALHGDDAPPRLVLLDDPANAAVGASLSDAPLSNTERTARLTPQSLAYVIYTSGTTGRPKGILHPWLTLDAWIGWSTLQHTVRCATRTAVSTTIGFDASLTEIMTGLCSGGTLTVVDQDTASDLLALVSPSGPRVQSMHLTPSLFQSWAANTAPELANMGAIDALSFAGEALIFDTQTRRLLERLNTQCVFNDYGPGETHVVTSAALPLSAIEAEAAVTIGRPIAGSQVYVVDARLEPIPVGVTGEVLIGGVQVARGYIGRAGLTAEKFIADPFSGEAGARLYRTGDLARWRPDGTLDFLGRMDAQVKIRGMRVELGEIEATLSVCEGVAQAVVNAPKDEAGDPRLVAYLVPAALNGTHLADALGVTADTLTDPDRDITHTVPLEGLVDLNAIRAALKRTLPEHMVPSRFVGLSRVPLMASGKVDREALPQLEAAAARAVYEAPDGPIEAVVAEAVATLVGVDRVGRHDNFFALGGHSLMAVRLVAQLEAKTGKTLPLKTVFEAPTMAELAATLNKSGAEALPYDPLVRFALGSPTRPSLSLLAVHPFSGLGTPFRALAAPLAGTAEVIGISARGLAAGQPPFSSYREMLETYAAAIGPINDRQPVVLMGWSMGGPIAFDLAAQLSRAGRPAVGLIILDAVQGLTPGTVDKPRKGVKNFEAWCQERLQDFGASAAPREGQSSTALSTALIKTAAAHGMMDPVVLEGDPETLHRLARVSHGLDRITRKRHARAPFPGPTLIVRAAKAIEQSADPLLGWSSLCTDATGVDVPYGHFDLMQPHAALVVAERIREWINQTVGDAPGLPPIS